MPSLDGPLDRQRLRARRRLADVPRLPRPRLPAAPAPRLRDDHVRPPGPGRPRRLARAPRPLRTRRRAVDDRRRRASNTPRCSRCSTTTEPNTLELFQIWMNLPAADKMVDAHFTMLWDDDIPRHVGRRRDRHGDRRVASAMRRRRHRRPRRMRRATTQTSPSGTSAFDAGSSWTMPAAGDDVARVLYVFHGDGIEIEGETVGASTGAVVDASRDLDDLQFRRHRNARDAGPSDR